MRPTRGDYLVAGAIVVFLVLALALRSAVADLSQMGTGIRQTGQTLRTSAHQTAGEVRSAFATAADAADALPVVGASLAASLRRTGAVNAAALEREGVQTGDDLVASGRTGESDAHRIADLAALLAFFVPTALLLAVVVPPRLREARRT